eukprot:6233273-Prymnesium_polylepis.1
MVRTGRGSRTVEQLPALERIGILLRREAGEDAARSDGTAVRRGGAAARGSSLGDAQVNLRARARHAARRQLWRVQPQHARHQPDRRHVAQRQQRQTRRVRHAARRDLGRRARAPVRVERVVAGHR